MIGSDLLPQGDYYQALFKIQVEMKNLGWEEKATIWNNWYLELNNPLIPEELPTSLSLVNPAFHFDWRGNKLSLLEEGWGPREGSNCEFFEISGVECPWNEDPILRPTMNRDHRWPKSLGGPESGFNLLWLCETHNLAKGNGLWGFDWSEAPKWLDGRLKELRKKKLLGMTQND